MCRLIDLVCALPHTLNHGDFHSENIFLITEKPTDMRTLQVKVIDFEMMAWRPIGYDLFLFLRNGLPTLGPELSLTDAISIILDRYSDGMEDGQKGKNASVKLRKQCTEAVLAVFVLSLPWQMAFWGLFEGMIYSYYHKLFPDVSSASEIRKQLHQWTTAVLDLADQILPAETRDIVE